MQAPAIRHSPGGDPSQANGDEFWLPRAWPAVTQWGKSILIARHWLLDVQGTHVGGETEPMLQIFPPPASVNLTGHDDEGHAGQPFFLFLFFFLDLAEAPRTPKDARMAAAPFTKSARPSMPASLPPKRPRPRPGPTHHRTVGKPGAQEAGIE
jgi:hypothetical protein